MKTDNSIKKITSDLVKIISYSIQFLLYILLYFFPKKENTWVYGYDNGSEFTDNSKWLFLYTSKSKPDITSVWLTRRKDIAVELRSQGYKSYTFHSVRGIYYCLISGNVFITHTRKDVLWWCTGNATVIRLGHGIPFKQFGQANPSEGVEKNILFEYSSAFSIEDYDFSIATSQHHAKLVSKATGLDLDRVLITGLPRHDAFSDELSNLDLEMNNDVFTSIPKSSESKTTIFYFPTWREINTSPIPTEISFTQLNQELIDLNAHLVIRPHINSTLNITQEYSNISILRKGYDFYPIFSHIDLFITDYSSLFYDALFLNIPILFFPHDFDEFASERSFFFEYSTLPGEQIYLPEKFTPKVLDILQNLERYQDRFDEKSNNWFHKTFKYDDFNNSRRVVSEIKERR